MINGGMMKQAMYSLNDSMMPNSLQRTARFG